MFTSSFIMFFLPFFSFSFKQLLLTNSHPTLCVFSGEYVAQFKFTVLLMANGPHRITNGPFDPELYKSEHEVQDPELKVNTLNSLELHRTSLSCRNWWCHTFYPLSTETSLLFPRLCYRALQAVKHRRKRKRR